MRVDSELAEDRAAELGYRETCARELAMRDWYSLRGEPGETAPTPKAFKTLVERLRVKKWAKAHPEKKAEHHSRYYRKPGVAERQTALAKKRRHDRFKKAAEVIQCAGCGVRFCETAPRPGGQPRRFCSRLCFRRDHYGRVVRPKAGRQVTNCGACGQAGHNRRRCEIAATATREAA